MFLFSRINVRANDISIGPTSKERFVFEVFWNFNSSIKNWHSYADISFTFSASEEIAVGGNDISVYLSVKALNSLQSYKLYYLDSRPAHPNNFRNISSSCTERIKVFGKLVAEQTRRSIEAKLFIASLSQGNAQK